MYVSFSGLQTPSLQPVSAEEKDGSGLVELEKVVTPSPEECRNLFNTDLDAFHNECCLKAGPGINLKDHRCSVKSLLEKAMAGQKTTVGNASALQLFLNSILISRSLQIPQMTLSIQ